MNSKLKMMLALGAILLVACVSAVAEEPKEQSAPPEMPPMGPPEEMKQIAHLVGVWDYTMMMKMDMASDSMTKSTGTSTCESILDGAAMVMHFDGGEMMGMKFKGFGIQTYDREFKRWQMTWTDNMSARTSLYTGVHAGDSTVMEGTDHMGGQTWLSRITSYNEKPESYDWRMESSMDSGKTWMVVATAKYAKRK